MSAAIQFIDVSILFPGSRNGNRAMIARALQQLAEGRSRAEILASTGAVLGVARANLDVAEGEISVLMGLSGSGKTTLLRAVNGLNKVTSGQILVRHKDGVLDAAQPTPATLHKLRTESVAMVFQQFGLLPWRTVRENVRLGLELRGMKPSEYKAVVDEKLELVGLTQWADRFASELSGGMQQRVGLARALATDADILLMDEPFSALDPLIRTKLQDELLSLQRHVRKTILFVSHDLDEALKIGNRISIMEGGRIVQTGRPEDIILRPADDYVAEFVQHMNPLNALRAASVMRPVEAFSRSGNSLKFSCGIDYELLLDADNHPRSLRCDNGEIGIVPIEDGAAPDGMDRYVAAMKPETLLKDVLNVQQLSGHPTLICANGRIIGICRVKEILQAISGIDRQGRAAVLSAAEA
jgi:glycine betaine/proline transport system ATP-binding protein